LRLKISYAFTFTGALETDDSVLTVQ